jgi:hypothetical protein
MLPGQNAAILPAEKQIYDVIFSVFFFYDIELLGQ